MLPNTLSRGIPSQEIKGQISICQATNIGSNLPVSWDEIGIAQREDPLLQPLWVSRFRVPSRLPLLSYVDSSWVGQSVPIVQQVCTDHELTLPDLSLIPHLPYMSLCLLLVVSRLSCLCTYCHSPVYLSPSAADLNAR